MARSSPSPVVGLTGPAVLVTAGQLHTCALLDGGAVRCWGTVSIGDGMGGARSSASEVVGLDAGVTSLSAGATHTCAVRAGAVKCWGSDVFGEQGCGGCGIRLVAGDVTGLADDVVEVALGYSHSCARLGDGGVACWGFNTAGQCGDGQAVSPQRVPIHAVVFDAGVDHLYVGFATTYAMTGGVLRCVGVNGDGECASGTFAGSSTTTLRSLLDPRFTAISTGPTGRHACAVIDAGVWCWGADDNGQLGDGLMAAKNVPVPVQGLAEPARAVAAGSEHTCAVTERGAVYCWGSNAHGQLGIGTTGGFSLTPQLVH
jgi:alpha-tubulin suppressor-like RCC1 family protein